MPQQHHSQYSQQSQQGGSGASLLAKFSNVLEIQNRGGGGASASYGGGTSDDNSFSYGFAQLRGKRMTMEDFQDCRIEKVHNRSVGMFGVFDGHGGSRAAEYVKAYLFNNLMKHSSFLTDIKTAIIDTFNQTDKDYLVLDDGEVRDAGSTASTAIIIGNRLIVANVGDSRTVISRKGIASALSVDHKPNKNEERVRIEQAGGTVTWAGTWRVSGVLAVSRAFGDRMLKKYVIAEPDVKEVEINNEVECLILASDGLWDVIDEQASTAIASKFEHAEEAARELTEESYRRGSADNITCIVIRFNR